MGRRGTNRTKRGLVEKTLMVRAIHETNGAQRAGGYDKEGLPFTVHFGLVPAVVPIA
jgi:hypothetical protein